jgi:hypothetical protein
VTIAAITRTHSHNSNAHQQPPYIDFHCICGHFHHEIAAANTAPEERGVMERIPIAELAPSLPSPDTKVIKAVVTLLWPYSSSTRQFALLLADPDFRLRHRRGQVRVRFSGPAGRALGNSGICIGDEVILALQGAQYINDVGDVWTPGKSVEWELSFQQRLVTQVGSLESYHRSIKRLKLKI